MCVISEVADKLGSACDRHEMAMGALLRCVLDLGPPPVSESLKSGRKRAAAAIDGSA